MLGCDLCVDLCRSQADPVQLSARQKHSSCNMPLTRPTQTQQRPALGPAANEAANMTTIFTHTQLKATQQMTSQFKPHTRHYGDAAGARRQQKLLLLMASLVFLHSRAVMQKLLLLMASMMLLLSRATMGLPKAQGGRSMSRKWIQMTILTHSCQAHSQGKKRNT